MGGELNFLNKELFKVCRSPIWINGRIMNIGQNGLKFIFTNCSMWAQYTTTRKQVHWFIKRSSVSIILNNYFNFSLIPFEVGNMLTLISAWISDHVHHKVWDEINISFPNYNSETVEWVTNFVPHYIGLGVWWSQIHFGIKVNPR